MSETIPDLLDPGTLLEVVARIEAIYTAELRGELEPGELLMKHQPVYAYYVTEGKRTVTRAPPSGRFS